MTLQLIRSRRVLTPEGLRPASVHVRDGVIARVSGWDDVSGAATPDDVGDLVIMPGLVDTHVHVNEPGRTEWEGFATATRAAAAGGVTTLLDMPLNSIPATTSARALEAKRDAAAGQCRVDVGFIGGVVPGNAGELAELRAAGVLAFKCFLVPSGVQEFRAVDQADLEAAFPVLAALGAPLMVHAEHPAFIVADQPGGGGYPAYLASRPAAAERAAIEMLVGLMERWPMRVHIVHLSSAAGLDVVRAARARGLPLSAETCPHYLAFSADDVPEGATEYKCAPPIRSADDRDALWTGLRAGDITQVVSDHSPSPPSMKESGGDFFRAWGGIASLQLGLPVVWSAARERQVPLERVSAWMSTAPAALAGLSSRKGAITVGRDADLVVFDPDDTFVVDPAALFHRHPITPYAGRRLSGVVTRTYVRGELVHGSAHASPACGLLLRPT